MDDCQIKLERPLFYNNPFGLRFEIGPPNIKIWSEGHDSLNKKYFDLAYERAMSIFHEAFEPNDEISLSYQIYSDGRKKIKKRSFIFNQIRGLYTRNIVFTTHRDIYSEYFENKSQCWRRVTISNLTIADINVKQITLAAINRDFCAKKPRMRGECYITNKTKQLVLNIYDDRGMDVVSMKKESLRGLYKSHNSLILDSDREKINGLFS